MRMSVAELKQWQKRTLDKNAGVGLVSTGREREPKMNRLEADYAALLQARQIAGEVLWWAYEAMTLKLADDTRYTVDFFVMLANGELEAHETKGFMRDDALVKIKVAAAMFPFRFRKITRDKPKDGGAWREKVYE